MKSKYKKTIYHSYKDKILLDFKYRASIKLTSKYKTSKQYYRSTVINYIIYNEKSHIVSLFKDYLIIDDCSEFLKRYYTKSESIKRLTKFFDYYDTYSKIFPNYTSILEGKYIYYNIQRKQRIINIQEEMELEGKINKKHHYSDEVFSTDIYDSIVNDRNNEDLEEVFNLNDNSYEEYSKLKELLNEIERNDNDKLGNWNYYNNSKINLNQSGNIIYIQPTLNVKNSISSKKRLMISSLLGRNQSMCNNNVKTLCLNNNNYNNSTTRRSYYHNNQNNNSNSINNSNVPLTDRPSSAKKKAINSNAIIKPPHSRKFNRTKIISDYPKTVFNDDFIHSRINKTTDKGISLQNKQYIKKENNNEEFNKEKERDQSEKAHVKTPPKYSNNIIYIINQNPKFMTNVTLLNNPNHKSSSTKSLALVQTQSQNSKGQTQSYHVKALSNIQQLIPKNKGKKIEAIKGSSKNNIIEQYLFDNQTARTRNNGNHLMSKELLISSRESSNKDCLNSKTSAQMTIVHKNNSKGIINNFNTTAKEHNTFKSTSKENLTQRNKNYTLKIRNDSSVSKKNNVILRHGTLAFTNISNNKPAIKGIQINNFNKVLGLNFTGANSDRNDKQGYYNR